MHWPLTKSKKADSLVRLWTLSPHVRHRRYELGSCDLFLDGLMWAVKHWMFFFNHQLRTLLGQLVFNDGGLGGLALHRHCIDSHCDVVATCEVVLARACGIGGQVASCVASFGVLDV